MNRTDESTRNALKRIEELEHQRRMEKHCEDKQKKKDDTRRYILIGKLVCKHWPDVVKYQQWHSTAESMENFSDLEKILAYVAAHPELFEAAKNWGM